MSYESRTEHIISYEYDFAVHGGAQGDIALTCLGPNALEAGLVVKSAVVEILTPFTGTSSVITVGDGTDPDGFFLDLDAQTGIHPSASLLGGALLTTIVSADMTATKVYKCTSSTVVEATITTGDITAGKMRIDFFVYKP